MAIVNGTGMAYMHDIPEKWYDENADGIVDTTRSVYEMRIAGRRVLLVSVVNADSSLLIQIGKPDAEKTYMWNVTTCSAAKGLHEISSSDGNVVPDGVANHIDGISVQNYIYPNILTILVQQYALGIPIE